MHSLLTLKQASRLLERRNSQHFVKEIHLIGFKYKESFLKGFSQLKYLLSLTFDFTVSCSQFYSWLIFNFFLHHDRKSLSTHIKHHLDISWKLLNYLHISIQVFFDCLQKTRINNNMNENHDIAIAMSSSLADPVLGLNILQG